MKAEFMVDEKRIELYGGAAGAPVVYLNTVQNEGETVWATCGALGCPPFTLAAISGLQWGRDMTPWAAPGLSKKEPPFGGGADDYLELLTGQIMPRVEAVLGGAPAYSALAGYSLAGLFAVYAAYRSAAFKRFASVSGSLWYPDFVPFAQSHEMTAKPQCVYFSLGDRESRAGNAQLATVQTQTELLAEWVDAQEVRTTFVLNPGGHFNEPNSRVARAILWILAENESR